MAIFKSLTFDGVNSLDYGIYITGEAVYNAPERAVELVNIAGKNGALVLDQGRFENIEVKYHAGCFADNQEDFARKVMKFRNVLASRFHYVRLSDDYHEDEYRMALYKDGLEVEAVQYSTAGEFDITFNAKPQRFLTSGEVPVTADDYGDVQTESGSLVTIDNDGSLGIKSLKVSLDPIQDLHGYDKPWSGGNGKNKCSLSDNTFVQYIEKEIEPIPSGTYVFSAVVTSTDTDANTCAIIFLDENKATLISKPIDRSVGGARVGTSSFTVSVPIKYIRFYASTGYPSGEGDTATFADIMIESGSSNTAFEPYSNICPISGRTEVVTQRTGKNLLPKYAEGTTRTQNGITGTANADGSITYVGTSTGTFWGLGSSDAVLIKAGTYTLSARNNTDISINLVNADTGTYIDGITGSNSKAITFANDTKIYYYTAIASGKTVDTTATYQLELGSTATDYEPYEGETYTTDLGRTVYGGTLDVVSGELVVDRAMVDLGSLSWTYRASPGIFQASLDFSYATDNAIESISSAYSFRGVATSGAQANVDGTFSLYTGNTFLWICNKAYTDATAFTASLSGQTAVIPLATPQTYQLTPQQVELLTGENNVWSDGGDVTLEYGTSPFFNPTPFDAKPLIKVVGTGTVQINDVTIAISESPTTIDCEAMEAYNGTESRNGDIVLTPNEFPTLHEGMNEVEAGSGITTLEITPRWWRV